MTPDKLAELHALGFQTPRPWTASEFQTFLEMPEVFLIGDEKCFLLARMVADEAEILTLLSHPEHRRKGLAVDRLGKLETQTRTKGCNQIFLEVAASNTAARALYTSQGYTESGTRSDYYREPNGTKIDALVLSKVLT